MLLAVSFVSYFAMETPDKLKRRKELRTKRDVEGRHARFIAEYVRIKHAGVYREANCCYNTIREKNPDKKDARKTDEFTRLTTQYQSRRAYYLRHRYGQPPSQRYNDNLQLNIELMDVGIQTPPETQTETPPETQPETPPETQTETPPETQTETQPETQTETHRHSHRQRHRHSHRQRHRHSHRQRHRHSQRHCQRHRHSLSFLTFLTMCLRGCSMKYEATRTLTSFLMNGNNHPRVKIATWTWGKLVDRHL